MPQPFAWISRFDCCYAAKWRTPFHRLVGSQQCAGQGTHLAQARAAAAPACMHTPARGVRLRHAHAPTACRTPAGLARRPTPTCPHRQHPAPAARAGAGTGAGGGSGSSTGSSGVGEGGGVPPPWGSAGGGGGGGDGGGGEGAGGEGGHQPPAGPARKWFQVSALAMGRLRGLAPLRPQCRHSGGPPSLTHACVCELCPGERLTVSLHVP